VTAELRETRPLLDIRKTTEHAISSWTYTQVWRDARSHPRFQTSISNPLKSQYWLPTPNTDP